MSAPNFRLAVTEDLASILAMMPLYYEDDSLPFDSARATSAVEKVLGDPAFGKVWLISTAADERAVGYLAITYGFSLEFGGREAFVDELYVHRDFRGEGIGSAAIRHAIDECRNDGLAAIRLEVTPKNTRALKLYTGLGFQDFGRSLLAYPLVT